MFYVFVQERRLAVDLLGTIVLGNGLGSLRNGVLGQLTGEDKADSSLDFLAGNGGTLVVSGELARLVGNALKNVIDKAVHDGHGLLGDVDGGMAQAEDLEDIAAVGLVAAALASLFSTGSLLDSALSGGLAGGLLFSFGGH